MASLVECVSIEDVRTNIDRIDRQIVDLIAERGVYVSQAAKFKRTADDVKAPRRVEQVIEKVAALARDLKANPDVVERVYRAMIAAFIDAELTEYTLKVQSGTALISED